MLRPIFEAFLFVVAVLVVYRFRHAIVRGLRQFDERNVQRIADEERDRRDPVAHFRHTLNVAGEQVEEVSEITEPDERLGTPVTRYVFEGERFFNRADAERVRAEKIRNIARGYYVDLPVALAEKRKDKLN
jgi:hypothetical protein